VRLREARELDVNTDERTVEEDGDGMALAWVT
jgi:hypothetical protein